MYRCTICGDDLRNKPQFSPKPFKDNGKCCKDCYLITVQQAKKDRSRKKRGKL